MRTTMTRKTISHNSMTKSCESKSHGWNGKDKPQSTTGSRTDFTTSISSRNQDQPRGEIGEDERLTSMPNRTGLDQHRAQTLDQDQGQAPDLWGTLETRQPSKN